MIREHLSRLRTGGKCAVMVLFASLATQAWALGLGELELNSALNERLDASIEIYDAQSLQPTEIIVSMAGAEDFERVGVERFFFLTDIRFEVVYDRSGTGRVRLTSSQPITEPYLNFLVEVLWPNGRLLKEYTLLLDPPTFTQAAAPRVSAPSRTTETASAGRIAREEPRRSGTQVQLAERAPASARAGAPSPLDQGVVDGEYRMTDRDDTLWSIASRTRPSANVSVYQNMLAIQRLNPEAFLNGNINYLKAGYTLRLPTEEQAMVVDQAEAIQMVARQNEEWRALSRGEQVAEQPAVAPPDRQNADAAGSELRGQLDATADTARAAAPGQARDGELRIVAGEGDSVSGVPAAGADPQELASAKEEQDRLNREVLALTSELDREKELAANQLAVKERQLDVKDQQIAEMQSEMERMRSELEQLRDAQSQNQSAAQGEAPSAGEPWWQSTYVVAGAAGVLVLLLAYGLIAARRRRAAEDAFDPAEALAEEAAEDEGYATRMSPTVSGAATVGAVAAGMAAAEPQDAVEREAEQEEVSAQTSETSDVIGEAEIYIAYGRYPQAIALLEGVLAEQPDRNDVRIKLLELLAETRDRTAFDLHVAELQQRCDDEEALASTRDLARQFAGSEAALEESAPAQAAGLEDVLSENESTADSETAAVNGAEELLEPSMESFDESLEESLEESLDASLGESTEASFDIVPEEQRPEALAAQRHTEVSDFELQLDEPQADTTASEQLGGDLGIDFKLDDDEVDDDVDELLDVLDDDIGAERAHAGELAVQASDVEDALASLDDVELDLDLSADDAGDEDEFDFGEDADMGTTKLDLARAYIDMGDEDGARDILSEVISEGNEDQRRQAQALLDQL